MSDFWMALVPTLVGGLIAATATLFAAYFGYRLFRSGQDKDRAEAAAAALMVELSQFADRYDVFFDWARFGRAKGDERPVAPSQSSVSIAVELLVMATSGKDREVARRVSDAWTRISGRHTKRTYTTSAVAQLALAVADWRTGTQTGVALEISIRKAEGLAAGTVEIQGNDPIG